MIGSEMAARFPATAVRVALTAWREGGDYRNAYEVLVAAFGADQADGLLRLHAEGPALLAAVQADGGTRTADTHHD